MENHRQLVDYARNVIDRTEAARALAKCIAYLACGNRDKAIWWAQELLMILGLKGEV